MRTAKRISLIALGLLSIATLSWGEKPCRVWQQWAKTYEGTYLRRSDKDPSTIYINLKESGKLFGLKINGMSEEDKAYLKTLEEQPQ